MCAAVPGVPMDQISEWEKLDILHSDFTSCMVLELFAHIRISGSKLFLTVNIVTHATKRDGHLNFSKTGKILRNIRVVQSPLKKACLFHRAVYLKKVKSI